MLFFLILCNKYNYETVGSHSITLKAGKYTVHCYGAQGGRSYSGGNLNKYGGSGAYVYGTMSISGSGTTFYINVGGKGKENKYGDRDGGWNGGGRSGLDKFAATKGNDGPGSGGGATDIRIDSNDFSNRIMVAAGGSGAADHCPGAPGGDLYGRRMTSNKGSPQISYDVTQTAGNANGVGGNGKKSEYVPGSGGGGGWRGGISSGDYAFKESSSYKAVAHSGSSYISGHSGCATHSKLSFTDTHMYVGQKTNDGQVIIYVVYECPENCESCTAEDKCTKCLGSYLLSYDATKCLSSCPSGYYDNKNGKCEICSTNCNTCVDSSQKCTSCTGTKALYEEKCLDVCPSHYTSVSNVCQPCEGCEECSGATDKCTKCAEGSFLQGDKCLPKCNDGFIGFDRVCEACTSNCATCEGSVATCTSCIGGYYLHFHQCVPECPPGFTKSGKECVKCDSSCSECSGSSKTCTECPRGYYLSEDKTCQLECNEGFFGEDRVCKECSSSCKGCDSTSKTCTSCKDGSYLHNNKCVNPCPPGTGAVGGVCQSCASSSCSKCDGDVTTCTECFNGYKLIGKKCEYQCNIPTASPSYSPTASPMASETATPSFSPTETPTNSPVATPSNTQPDSEDESATSSVDDSEPVSKARLVSDEITCSDCPAICTECSSSTECTVCEEGLLLYGHECVTSCPTGTKAVESKCLPCSVLNCELCNEGISTCKKCKEGLVLYENKCRKECPVGYIDVSGICEKCDGSCYDCVETKKKCTSCNEGSTFDENENTCSGSCNNGYVSFNGKCEKCAEGCSTCKEAKTTCTSCDVGYYLHHNQCISNCPKGYTFVEEKGNVCVQCIGCSECSGSPTHCNNCPAGLFMKGNECVSSCEKGEYGANKQCLPCAYPCSECIDDAKTCTACAAGYSLDGDECSNGCKKGMVSVNGVCQSCTSNCETCENTQSECLTCIEGFNLLGRSCITNCPPGMIGIDRKCENCTSPCAECATNQTFCTKCEDNYLFYENHCYEECPFNTIPSNDTCIKCHDSCQGCNNTIYQCLSCSENYFRFRDRCYSECASVNDPDIPQSSEVVYYGNNYENFTCDECLDMECVNCANNYSYCDECLGDLQANYSGCYPPPVVYIDNCTDASRCGYTVRKDTNVTVIISVSNFTNIRGKNDGGGFYIINSAVNCTDAWFVNITSEGGGGAIYVKNWKHLKNDVIFEDLYFLRCKAQYGGAVYAYSAGDQNTVSVKKCKFYSNEVDPAGGRSTDGRMQLVGGNALFVTAKNAEVKKCTFENNKGTTASVKIFNRFEQDDALDQSIVIFKNRTYVNSNIIENLSGEGSKVVILECTMKISRKEKHSIYVEGSEMSNLEIRDCKFTGKLPKGAKYIGGKIHPKNIPKVQVNNCEFETKGKSAMSFEIIDDDLF